MPRRPPNLLLVTTDQHHWRAMGTRGPHVRTPNLDRLAARGVDFTRAYCPNPTCTPTRASLITGLWPSAHGAHTLGTKLDERVPVLGDLLRGLGYSCGLIGKAHFQPLRSTPECPSIESYPTIRDLDFWRDFDPAHAPWYGFDHVETCRNHADEGHAGQHYALWLESKGLADWRDYFQPRQDGVRDTPTDGSKAPPIGPGHGWRADAHWRLPADLHYTAWTGERTDAFIRARRDAGRPWFCWSSYHDPHPPYCAPEPWASLYDPADMGGLIGSYRPGEFDDMPPPHRMTRAATPDPAAPGFTDPGFAAFDEDGFGTHGYHRHDDVDERHLREAAAVYCGMIGFVDERIGRTLDLLDETGQADDTLVVFTSDHGHFLGQHGLCAKGPFHYEDVIRVPMIAAGPGLPRGVANDAPQTLVDVPATFAAAAGAGVPRHMQGRDMRAAWAAGRGRDAVIVENHHNGAAVHLRTLVTPTHKLTVYRGRPDWGEAFDLLDDPHERTNLFHRDAPLRSRLMEQLVQADLEREPAPQPRVAGA